LTKRVLQPICGLKQENDVYRRRYNFELERDFKSPCEINIVKTNRIRYAGHMIRRLEDLPQKAILIAKWADGVNRLDAPSSG
jgi:hypothetical protein